MRRRHPLACAAAIVLAWAAAARAQEDGGTVAPATGTTAAAAAAGTVTPPALRTRVEAPYPAEALKARAEGTVGLELEVDATGHVTSAKVTSPAGHGLDEAALAAARQFVFTPATRDGKPIASTIELGYDFHLPPAPASPPPKAKPKPARRPKEVTQRGAGQSTLVLARKPISAASSFDVRDRDFALRPIGSVQDILRVMPGLVMVQHSGGGKANQYFLRGFDADHGTDIAFSVDGVPINMPSHAHGQGFSDTNFIIPEVVEHVQVTKGPYFASQGDFATAGAADLITRDRFEHSSVGFGFGGSPGHGGPSYRALAIASPRFADSVDAIFAAEAGRQDGPFENPENWDRYKLFNKLTWHVSPTSSVSLTEMSYGANWHGSGQIPARAVEEGLLDRFGSIDPDEGGNTARHQVVLQYALRPNEHSQIKALAYAGTYRFNLFSNFTLYARDPDNGDEIEQVDRRAFYGGKVSYRVVHHVRKVRFDTTVGADMRSDDIEEQLWNSVERTQLDQVRGNAVHETLLGMYLNEEVTPLSWLRLDVGGRGDLLTFAVDDTLHSADPAAPRSGASAAYQISPKMSAVVTPVARKNAQLDLYLNYGSGYHSNDVRGVFSTPSVTPLTRAIGEEVGARTRLWDRWDLAASLWQLDLASETVWNGDDGTTEVSGATNRKGIELETRLEVTRWLAADLDLTFTDSAFTENHGNGNGLALAPKETWAGGVSARHRLGPGEVRGGFRFFGIGDRPASDDGVLVAPGFTQFDLHLGYRHRRFDVALDIENLFDQAFRSAQFATVSRLRGEPAIGAPVPAGFSCGSGGRLAPSPGGAADGRFYGCEDVDYTPTYPFTARITTTIYLD